MFANDLLGAQRPTVQFTTGAAIGAQRRALQRNSCEQSTRPRIAEDLRAHHYIRVGGGRTPLRPYRSGGIRAELHLASENGGGTSCVHHQQNKIRGLAAKLKSNVSAFQREHGGSAPRPRVVFARAAGNRAASKIAAHANCKF